MLNFGTGAADRFTNNAKMNLIDTIVSGELRSPSGSQIDVGGSVVFNGPFSGGATFPGAGNVTFNDIYSPGDSPAMITFGNDFQLGPQSILEMEVGGLIAGSQHDFINVYGNASLGGLLRVSFLNGYVLMPGDSVALMQWGSHSGSMSLETISGYAGLGLTPIYSQSGLSVQATAMAGDANLDGAVNTIDFNLLAGNFSAGSATWMQGDFNHDDVVDSLDFNSLLSNYGQRSVPQPGLGALVPEPGTLSLICLGGLAIVRRRRL